MLGIEDREMNRLLCLVCGAVLLTSALATSAAAADDENIPCEKVESIGAASMDDDRVISMRIRSLPPGPIAEQQSKSGPRSKGYVDLFNHLGGIVPGQTKPVKPWCN